MCFSVNINLVKEELENRYGATLIDPDKYRPSYYYHAFQLPEMPVICSEYSSAIKLATWGLIPSWTKTLDDANIIRYKTFNARAESLSEKASYSASFRSSRCIIPVKGFFEWQHVGKQKVPWYIYHYADEILSLAGLYDEWVMNSTGETLYTFSIITTDANNLMAEIHNSAKRMPVLLDKGSESEWLDLSNSNETLMELLKPCSSDLLKAYTVGNLVNSKSSDRNSPEVIRPYTWPSQNLLF